MKIAVLDADTLGKDLSLSPLNSLGDVTVYANTKPSELAARIADCDVILQNKVKITREALAGAKQLKVIAEAATGYDNIDLGAAREFGIAVCNVPGYSTPSVVQVTVATALSLITHMPAYLSHVSSGRYTEEGVPNCLVPPFHELAGMTWGIVGYGNIGKGVAAVARAFGCRVVYTRKNPDSSPDCLTLDELCRAADIISIHTPLSAQTRALIGKEQIKAMKDGVILINEARGAVTDEAAVAEGIRSGKIGGFGCDVYSTEPFPKDHPFYSLKDSERVCLTPHMAWGSYEARVRCLSVMISNIRAFFNGEKQNRVD